MAGAATLDVTDDTHDTLLVCATTTTRRVMQLFDGWWRHRLLYPCRKKKGLYFVFLNKNPDTTFRNIIQGKEWHAVCKTWFFVVVLFCFHSLSIHRSLDWISKDRKQQQQQIPANTFFFFFQVKKVTVKVQHSLYTLKYYACTKKKKKISKKNVLFHKDHHAQDPCW